MTSLSSSNRLKQIRSQQPTSEPSKLRTQEPPSPQSSTRHYLPKIHKQNLKIADNQMLRFSLKRNYKNAFNFAIKKDRLGDVLQNIFAF